MERERGQLRFGRRWCGAGGAKQAVAMQGRISIPQPSELRDDVAQLLPLTAQPGREPAKTMAILARQPELLAPFLG